jgi:hypothetical protein
MLAASVDDEQVRQCLSFPRFTFFLCLKAG